MDEKRFEVPQWMPRAIRNNRPESGEGVGAALKFGALYIGSLLGSLWNRVGNGFFVLLAIGWSILILRDGTDLPFQLAVVACGVSSAYVWFSARPHESPGRRIGGAVFVGVTCVLVSAAVLVILGVLAIPAVLIVDWWRRSEAKADRELQREFREPVTSLKPWTVFWALVKNDDEDATEWAKPRPCIALPPYSTWSDGVPPLDQKAAGYPKGWLSDGYPVMTCTSQVKRKDDSRYLEVRPLPSNLTRSFVRLEVRHFVVAPSASQESRLADMEVFERGEIDGLVLLQNLGPLLNLQDRQRIIDGLNSSSTKVKEEPSVPVQVPREQFQATLSHLGNPHQLWHSLMPTVYSNLSDDARMELVRLIPDCVYWSIAAQNPLLPWPDLTGLVDHRHCQHAVMTGVMLKRSEPYRVIVRRYASKEFLFAETWLRYALLLVGPRSIGGDFQETLQKALSEMDIDLLNQHLGSSTVRQIVAVWADQ